MAVILVVDDDPDILDLIVFVLQGADHEVLAASGPTPALAHAASRDLDLVITDFHMPDMTGADLVRQLRKSPSRNDVPAILVTAAATKSTVPDGLFTRWITKPFAPRSLRAEVNDVLATTPNPRRLR
ncbi:response regulator [Actinoplanes sp. NPDC024001]|uniref:response regulator n=1 Tax=unclassified Actinoplanes TaxID=2626549 RepID=UPI002E22CD43